VRLISLVLWVLAWFFLEPNFQHFACRSHGDLQGWRTPKAYDEFSHCLSIFCQGIASLQEYINPKGWSPFCGPYLKFGQAIVDAIFVQKISNFWWTYGIALASRRINVYQIPIYGNIVMSPKHSFFCHVGSFGQPKNFLFSNFFGLDFFHKFLTKFLNISSTWKSSKTHQIY
jgi:hypothetical protein